MSELLGCDAKILLVEDDETLARTTVRVLEDERRTFRVAPDVARAKAALDREPWDLVLCDFQLPDGVGSMVLAHARDRRPDAPRILVTSHTDWSTAATSVNAGEVFRIVAKPWSDVVLRSVVAQGLAAKRLRDEHRALVELATRQARELDEARVRAELRTQELDAHVERWIDALATAVDAAAEPGRFELVGLERALADALGLTREEILVRAGPRLFDLARSLDRLARGEPARACPTSDVRAALRRE